MFAERKENVLGGVSGQAGVFSVGGSGYAADEMESPCPYLCTLLNPFQYSGFIPDVSLQPRVLKDQRYSATLTGATDYLIVVRGHNKRNQIWVYHPVNINNKYVPYNWTLSQVIVPDEKLSDQYTDDRTVSFGVDILSSTQSTTNLPISGTIDAVYTRVSPDDRRITTSNISTYRQDPFAVMTGSLVAAGVNITFDAADDLRFTPTDTNAVVSTTDSRYDFQWSVGVVPGDVVTGTPAQEEWNFNASNLLPQPSFGAEIFFTNTDGNLPYPLLGRTSFDISIQVPTESAEYPTYTPPPHMTLVVWRTDQSVTKYNLLGNCPQVKLTPSLTSTRTPIRGGSKSDSDVEFVETTDKKEKKIEVKEKETKKIGVVPPFDYTLINFHGSFYSDGNAPIAAVGLYYNAADPDFQDDLSEGYNDEIRGTIRIRNEDIFASGYSTPTAMVLISGVEDNQKILVKGVRWSEATPNATLIKNRKVDYPTGLNVTDMDHVRDAMAAYASAGYSRIMTSLDYKSFQRSSLFSHMTTRSTMIGAAMDWRRGLKNALKWVGKNFLKPALIGGLNSLTSSLPRLINNITETGQDSLVSFTGSSQMRKEHVSTLGWDYYVSGAKDEDKFDQKAFVLTMELARDYGDKYSIIEARSLIEVAKVLPSNFFGAVDRKMLLETIRDPTSQMFLTLLSQTIENIEIRDLCARCMYDEEDCCCEDDEYDVECSCVTSCCDNCVGEVKAILNYALEIASDVIKSGKFTKSYYSSDEDGKFEGDSDMKGSAMDPEEKIGVMVGTAIQPLFGNEYKLVRSLEFKSYVEVARDGAPTWTTYLNPAYVNPILRASMLSGNSELTDLCPIRFQNFPLIVTSPVEGVMSCTVVVSLKPFRKHYSFNESRKVFMDSGKEVFYHHRPQKPGVHLDVSFKECHRQMFALADDFGFKNVFITLLEPGSITGSSCLLAAYLALYGAPAVALLSASMERGETDWELKTVGGAVEKCAYSERNSYPILICAKVDDFKDSQINFTTEAALLVKSVATDSKVQIVNHLPTVLLYVLQFVTRKPVVKQTTDIAEIRKLFEANKDKLTEQQRNDWGPILESGSAPVPWVESTIRYLSTVGTEVKGEAPKSKTAAARARRKSRKGTVPEDIKKRITEGGTLRKELVTDSKSHRVRVNGVFKDVSSKDILDFVRKIGYNVDPPSTLKSSIGEIMQIMMGNYQDELIARGYATPSTKKKKKKKKSTIKSFKEKAPEKPAEVEADLYETLAEFL